MGYRIPFLSHPPLSPVPIPMPSYNPLSTKGVALEEVTLGLVTKGAVELAPLPSPGFYSRLFVVWKTSGSSTSPTSIALWMCHTFRWRPSSLFSFLFVRVTGWPPSIFGRRTSRFQFIRSLVPFSALSPRVTSSSSKHCALAYPRLHRSSLGSWLLFPPFSTLWVSACADISTTG